MFFYITARLRFLLSATNQHGIHSPFVFKYITEGLYRKTGTGGNKVADVLLKSIRYFEAKNLYIAPNDPLKALIRRHYPELLFNDPPYDLVSMDIADWPVFYDQSSKMIRGNSVILLTGLYQNSQTLALWRAQLTSTQFNVSIDLFHCGLLFIRKEQQKEHFKVRI